jgi:hypothetical protein
MMLQLINLLYLLVHFDIAVPDWSLESPIRPGLPQGKFCLNFNTQDASFMLLLGDRLTK